ncbi:hypothetical protein ANTRET_LOCUS7707 [Anthophora retusa]
MLFIFNCFTSLLQRQKKKFPTKNRRKQKKKKERTTVRFSFIFIIRSVSTVNGLTSHILLYLWLDINIPRPRNVTRLLQFPCYYTAAGAC